MATAASPYATVLRPHRDRWLREDDVWLQPLSLSGKTTPIPETFSINARTTINPADKASDRTPDYRIVTAMHLFQAGLGMALIALWLGSPLGITRNSA